jgi:hypothetical protein
MNATFKKNYPKGRAHEEELINGTKTIKKPFYKHEAAPYKKSKPRGTEKCVHCNKQVVGTKCTNYDNVCQFHWNYSRESPLFDARPCQYEGEHTDRMCHKHHFPVFKGRNVIVRLVLTDDDDFEVEDEEIKFIATIVDDSRFLTDNTVTVTSSQFCDVIGRSDDISHREEKKLSDGTYQWTARVPVYCIYNICSPECI